MCYAAYEQYSGYNQHGCLPLPGKASTEEKLPDPQGTLSRTCHCTWLSSCCYIADKENIFQDGCPCMQRKLHTIASTLNFFVPFIHVSAWIALGPSKVFNIGVTLQSDKRSRGYTSWFTKFLKRNLGEGQSMRVVLFEHLALCGVFVWN